MAKYIKTRPDLGATSNTQPVVDVPGIVKGVINDIRMQGDTAVRRYSEKFDKWSPTNFKLSQKEIEACVSQCSEQTIADIKEVQNNVRAFAQAQKECLKDLEIEIRPGVVLGHKNVPIEYVGCYIPGGRYPLLASAHMTILTAKVAGCPHVAAFTPPMNGAPPAATVAAAHFAGADEIYILGGIQAVAAMAIGTETIQSVDFIAGPGNPFVAEAKRQLFGNMGTGIDLVAGSTEILIVGDETADPFTVATDLLSQAEHGPDTPAVFITTSEDLGTKTLHYCTELLKILPTAALAGVSWRDFGEIIVVPTMDDAWRLADDYASEHVQIFTKNPRDALSKMKNYGALFLGQRTCVSYGDKCIGTNHVLPTRKNAKNTGGLWVGKFLRTCTYQEVLDDKASGELGRLCGRAARAENFEGHARSGDLRAQKYLRDHYEWIDIGSASNDVANDYGIANNVH